MKATDTILWQSDSGSKLSTAVWQSEAGYPPPKQVILADDTMTGDAAYWRACSGTSMLYTGDFQNARQLLNAVTRRADRKPIKPTTTILETFHQHRARQIVRANVTNKILIELQHGTCNLSRSPELKEVVEAALGTAPPESLVLSLREALGMIGANEWRRKGVFIDALNANIHANYGVFSPVRGEYLDLINAAKLHAPQVAWDIGTGTGVIAAVLATRGISQVIGTDTCSRALQCAAQNIRRLNLQSEISFIEASLFPSGKADLIVCNPPWLPAKINTPIERAIYDPKSQMLKGFLQGAKAHLNSNGEAWLIMSNLAELIGLRGPDDLQNWIHQAGLSVVGKQDTSPGHSKSNDQSDSLYAARSKEITSLYRLTPADNESLAKR